MVVGSELDFQCSSLAYRQLRVIIKGYIEISALFRGAYGLAYVILLWVVSTLGIFDRLVIKVLLLTDLNLATFLQNAPLVDFVQLMRRPVR